VLFSLVMISRSSAVIVATAARDNTMRSRPAPTPSNGGSYEATIDTEVLLSLASEIVRFASSEGNNRPAVPVGCQRSGTTPFRPTQSKGNTSTSTCLANPRDPPGPTRIKNDAPSSAARLDSSISPPSASAASSAARAALNGNDNDECASTNTEPLIPFDGRSCADRPWESQFEITASSRAQEHSAMIGPVWAPVTT
jgi:hypothetical protein